MSVRVLYFASLRDRAGCDGETVDAGTKDVASLFDAARARHDFALPRERVRVAVNGDFVPWNHVAADGDEVAFLPPVSGG